MTDEAKRWRSTWGIVFRWGASSVSHCCSTFRTRQDKGFRPIETPRGADSAAEAAALLEVDYDGMCQQVWMKRKDPQFSFASIVTQQGRAMLTFDYQRVSLGLHRETPGLHPRSQFRQ